MTTGNQLLVLFVFFTATISLVAQETKKLTFKLIKI